MTATLSRHTPDLIRGLGVPLRGPGSSPGRVGLRCVYQNTSSYRDGSLRLYHGVPPERCALYWTNHKPRPKGRPAPVWDWKCAYGKVQDQNACLVRSAHRFRDIPTTGTGNQTLAQVVEECTDRRTQSVLAGYQQPHSRIVREVPGQARDVFDT